MEGQVLCITVRHLLGRYHGEEWPPSPARLFQAMVAGSRIGRPPALQNPEDTAAFRWLEELPPPSIAAPPVQPGTRYRLYVPNNDTDLVVRGRKSLGEIRTAKDVAPYILSPGSDEPSALHYLWPCPGGSTEPRASRITALSRATLCLGWGIDAVAADACVLSAAAADTLPGERWVPVANSDVLLNTPAPGFVDDLEEAYVRWRSRLSANTIDTAIHPTRYRRQPYANSRVFGHRGYTAFSLRHRDGGWSRTRWEDLIAPAAWLRHTAGQALADCYDPERTAAMVYGHGGDPNHRISYVPVPSVGHRQVDGEVRRVMVVWPVGCPADVPLGDILDGAPLFDTGGALRAVLRTMREADAVTQQYVRRSRVWLSTTPVVLHGHTGRKRSIELRKTRTLLLQALEKGGYPEQIIRDVWFQPAPFWAGPASAGRCRVPEHLSGYPRFHVGVEFHSDVQGPVLAGIGRHTGVGVFAAAR